ncbi:SDR family NAD(P)-dependent oxidoreductase [Alteromonas marina]|uniref:SDR family NAD(P)-dependent oxidoreductase n=1 Tax=unclassified Alteromonas TaxID=2614992 RepID=UPI0012E47958|nr:SDR family NAD(P)-dependent oxidoreductase [Alteromonas sp. KUL150]GFD76418.1 short-chain dehydrogenase [Tenacibaculum sp. KUL113]GFD87488.1 short-chain dehydrogenase [Alteromonas sp. KUL150]
MKNNVLIVGASGGIASALIEQYRLNDAAVIAVSRAPASEFTPKENVTYHQIAQQDDAHIGAFVKKLNEQGVVLNTVLITTGFLHNEEKEVHPEKRLEDISEQALSAYFSTNSITPALWLKHLVNIVSKEGSTLVCLSARVGSISDNGLGGWYGYRASKAALNMFVKTASVEYKRRVKDVMLVCYHPGTVDTGLSKPFQKNVAAKKLFTPEFTAKQLITHVSKLDRDQACHFIDWNGEVVTW